MRYSEAKWKSVPVYRERRIVVFNSLPRTRFWFHYRLIIAWIDQWAKWRRCSMSLLLFRWSSPLSTKMILSLAPVYRIRVCPNSVSLCLWCMSALDGDFHFVRLFAILTLPRKFPWNHWMNYYTSSTTNRTDTSKRARAQCWTGRILRLKLNGLEIVFMALFHCVALTPISFDFRSKHRKK